MRFPEEEKNCMPGQRNEACVFLKKRRTACLAREMRHAFSQGSEELHAWPEK